MPDSVCRMAGNYGKHDGRAIPTVDGPVLDRRICWWLSMVLGRRVGNGVWAAVTVELIDVNADRKETSRM